MILTVRALREFLEKVDNQDQRVIVRGRRRLFANAKLPTPALLTPGYNWRGAKEEPALLIEPSANEWGEDEDDK